MTEHLFEALDYIDRPGLRVHTAGGHRLAIYERTRPEATRHFEGRRDF